MHPEPELCMIFVLEVRASFILFPFHPSFDFDWMISQIFIITIIARLSYCYVFSLSQTITHHLGGAVTSATSKWHMANAKNSARCARLRVFEFFSCFDRKFLFLRHRPPSPPSVYLHGECMLFLFSFLSLLFRLSSNSHFVSHSLMAHKKRNQNLNYCRIGKLE